MVIFDLDGTLWDAAAVVAESWNLLIKQEYGYDKGLTPADISAQMGKTMNEIADIHFAELPQEERYALARKCEKFENDYFSKEHTGVLYDGVRETLKAIHEAGVKMAVVSNCQEGYVKAFMDTQDMWDVFDDYEEWGRTFLLKADNIKLVMERNGEDKAVYVGDIQKDADASHEAGVPVIWAKYGFGEMADAEGEIEHFAELPAVLKELGFM